MINEQELMQSIDNFLSENKEAMLADLKTLIGQPSVRGEAAPGAPYGKMCIRDRPKRPRPAHTAAAQRIPVHIAAAPLTHQKCVR